MKKLFLLIVIHLSFSLIAQEDKQIYAFVDKMPTLTSTVSLDNDSSGPCISSQIASQISCMKVGDKWYFSFVVEKDGGIASSSTGFSKRDLESLGERAGVRTFRPEDNVPEWKAG